MRYLPRSLFFLLTFALIYFFTVSELVLAQTLPPGAALVATVNIQHAKIVSQEGNTIHISFDLTNRVVPQSGVKYSVQLIRESEGGQFLADQYVYPEELTLAEHSLLHKDVTYTAPAGLSGSFDLLLVSKNNSGFPLALQKIATVTLAPTAGLELVANTCVVRVAGEQTSYALMQGVDIAANENLVLSCTAVNHGDLSLTATPTYETHYRTAYGEVVAVVGGDSASRTFSAHETKTIALALPKATTPQAYDALVALRAGTVSSNQIDVHYVVRGESATIQNESLDKNYYQTGDTALLSFLWSPSADGFVGSRLEQLASNNNHTAAPEMFYTVTLTDKNNTACAAPASGAVSGVAKQDVSLHITQNCVNPHVVLELQDASGNVLAHREVVITSEGLGSGGRTALLVFLGVLALILVGSIVYHKKRYA